MADAVAMPGSKTSAEGISSGGRRSLMAPNVERWPVDPSRPIVSLKNVSKGFGDKDVIRNLSLDIPTGQTTVIIGESGSGKSVLLKLMNGLLQADSGHVELFGKRLDRLGQAKLYETRKRTSMVLQNYALFDSANVLDNIGFPLRENTRISNAEIDERAMDLLEMLGLAHAAKMLPSELSGGMKKRVSFARAVISQPELVLFDEPTTGLDPVMIEFVDKLVQRMQERFQITSVIISHDISSVFKLADRIAMLHGGQIIAVGTPEEIETIKDERITRFISVGGSGRLTADSSTDEASHALVAEESEEAPLIEIVDLHKSFGSNHVLKGVSFPILPKKITVIIGGSGSGKSVIIKHIIGLFKPNSGEVRFAGQNMVTMNAKEIQGIRSRIGMLFQGAALFDSMTVRENVRFPLIERRGGISVKAADKRVDEVLDRLRLLEISERTPTDISNGQRKRVGLARAIVTRPEVMIYDEPTTGQDPIMIRYVDDMIVEAHEAFDLTSIVISHDMQSTFRVADRVAMLSFGEIVAFGTPDQVKASSSEVVQRFIFASSFDPEETLAMK